MMGPMRLFIGIPVPPDAVSRIRDIQDDLKDHVSRGTFSDEGNFHLTLAFLGGTDPDRVPSLIKALSPIDGTEFSLTFSHFGTFRGKQGDVAFIAPDEEPALQSLNDQVTKALKGASFPFDDRPFRPHLTLGRNVRFSGAYHPSFSPISFGCRSFHLYHSHRIDGKLTYTPLATFVLAG